MPMIFVRCPASALPIATGIETDADSFRRLPNVIAKVECPYCGMLHEWVANDVWRPAAASGRSSPPKT